MNWLDEPVLLFVDSSTISRNMKSAKQLTVNPEPLNVEQKKTIES
jgi:hypothetical protein